MHHSHSKLFHELVEKGPRFDNRQHWALLQEVEVLPHQEAILRVIIELALVFLAPAPPHVLSAFHSVEIVTEHD